MADVLEKEQKLIQTLMMEMIAFDTGDPKRINHFIKVHSLARTIALAENANTKAQIIIEAAALVHDIGILPAERKYGHCDEKLQEQEGGKYARTLMKEVGFSDDTIERVVWLVDHHHSYDDIKTFDHQVLVEADCLVNLYEDKIDENGVRKTLKEVFKTETGIELIYTMFGL